MTEPENIREYFTPNRRKLVAVQAVEKLAGMPINTLANFLLMGRAIPPRHIKNLIEVLQTVGYVPTTG